MYSRGAPRLNKQNIKWKITLYQEYSRLVLVPKTFTNRGNGTSKCFR